MAEELGIMSIGNMSAMVVKKPLAYRPKKVLELINTCIDTKQMLDVYVLQNWFMEEFVKHRNPRQYDEYKGKDEKGEPVWSYDSEYNIKKRMIKKNGGLLEGYYLSEPKAMLKYHIGNLVMNGYLLVLPTIQLAQIPEN